MLKIEATKKNLFLFSLLSFWNSAISQNVGIGTSTPDASAKLEVLSTNSGFLIPRVSLVAVSNGTSPIASPATSLLVYNTNAAVTGGNGTGYYFWNGSQWEKFITGTTTDWSLTGNSGTTAGTNFIGTTDAVDFVTKTNNLERMRINSSGQVGIGINPSYKLDLTHSSSLFDDRAVNINFSTSDNIGGYNAGLYVNSVSTGTGDLFGIYSYATPSGNNNASAIAGLVISSGNGERIAVAGQLSGSGENGAGLGAGVAGNWTNVYGLILDMNANASQKNYGLYVKGTTDYSGFMESGNFYINDTLSVGINADPPQAKLHVDGNIKSEFLASGFDRMLYTDNDGQITPLNNGIEGDVLTIGSSGTPEWGSGGPRIFFAQLPPTPNFGCTCNSPELLLSKEFTPFNDTVIIQFNMSANISSTTSGSELTSYEVILEAFGSGFYGSGIIINRAYGHLSSNTSEGVLNISFTIPMEATTGSNRVDVYLTKLSSGSASIEIDPTFNYTNATLVIYDLPTNP